MGRASVWLFIKEKESKKKKKMDGWISDSRRRRVNGLWRFTPTLASSSPNVGEETNQQQRLLYERRKDYTVALNFFLIK